MSGEVGTPRAPAARPVIAVALLVAAVLVGLLIQSPDQSTAGSVTPAPRKVVAPQTYAQEPASVRPQRLRQQPGTRLSRSEPGAVRESVTSGLDVTMESLSPSRLDPGSPIRVSGTITDVEDKGWTNLKVYLVLDRDPLRTSADLDAVLESEPDAVTGDRIADIGQFLELGDLAPGDSVAYTLEVPFPFLDLDAEQAGVYAVGVHVLADPERVTAGRARTLMPLLPTATDASPVDLTVMLPLRTPLVREPDGTYADFAAVLDQVAPGGRMRNLLDLAATAEAGHASLLLDPALVDLLLATAADDFAPPLEGTVPPPDDDDQPDLQTPVDGVASPAQRRYAAEFLADLRTVSQTVDILAEPYGAADVTAVRQLGSRALQRTVARVGAVALERADLEAERVLLPVGDLQPDQLAPLTETRTLVLGSDQVRGWDVTEGAATWIAGPGDDALAPAVVVDETLAQGGPEPGITDSPLQIRQRLLSETALLALGTSPLEESVDAARDGGGAAAGLVHLADGDWDPGVGQAGSDLFDELDAAWISPASLGEQLPAGDEVARAPAGSSSEESAGVSLTVVDAARDIRNRATLVQSLVGADSRLLRWYDRAAALTVSSHQRIASFAAAERAETVAAQLDRHLMRVSVEGPDFVTLSSDSGSFPITMTNNLSQPVTVGLTLSDSADALRFDEVPLETIEAGGSAQLTLEVGAPDLGVTEVTATLVTPNGRRFGTPATFNLRSSVVGVVIWVAFGAGGLFLVLLVVRRLGRRIVASRRGQVAS